MDSVWLDLLSQVLALTHLLPGGQKPFTLSCKQPVWEERRCNTFFFFSDTCAFGFRTDIEYRPDTSASLNSCMYDLPVWMWYNRYHCCIAHLAQTDSHITFFLVSILTDSRNRKRNIKNLWIHNSLWLTSEVLKLTACTSFSLHESRSLAVSWSSGRAVSSCSFAWRVFKSLPPPLQITALHAELTVTELIVKNSYLSLIVFINTVFILSSYVILCRPQVFPQNYLWCELKV